MKPTFITSGKLPHYLKHLSKPGLIEYRRIPRGEGLQGYYWVSENVLPDEVLDFIAGTANPSDFTIGPNQVAENGASSEDKESRMKPGRRPGADGKKVKVTVYIPSRTLGNLERIVRERGLKNLSALFEGCDQKL